MQAADSESDSTASAGSIEPKRRKRGSDARDSKAKSNQTELARRAKLANFRKEAERAAEVENYWEQHEISKPNFERQDDAEVLYNAAIEVMSTRKRKSVALDCCCSLSAIETAIKFLNLQEQRRPPGVSDADKRDRDEMIFQDFKIWHIFAFKKGPKILDPLIMLRIYKDVRYTVQVLQNATCTKSCKDFIRLIVTPAIQAEKAAQGLNSLVVDEGAELSKDARFRLWNLFCEEDITSKGNKGIQARQAAAKNPLGGLSLAAGWPTLINLLNIHPKCIVFCDAMAHLANHATTRLGYVKGKLPKGTKQLMRDEGWTCVFDRADVAAERCFSTDVAMAYDYANLSWTVHVYDITINKIDIIKVSEFGSVMFQPYSQASLNALDPASAAGPPPASASAVPFPASAVPPESLAKQVADEWTEKILLPTLKEYRAKLQANAVACNVDPNIYKNLLLVTDGESTHLNAILDHNIKRLAEEGFYFAKGPASLSGKYAIPDVGKNFPKMHADYIELMNSSTDAHINACIFAEPGLQHAIDVLMRTGMSAQHKETFRRLLALTPSIVASAVTPGIVNKAFNDAALWPVNDVKILQRCWPDFKMLPESQAQKLMTCVRGPLSDLFRETGMFVPSRVMEIVNADVPQVQFPERQVEDGAVLNRHGFMLLSHEFVQDKYEQRVFDDSASRMQNIIVRESKELIEKKLVARMAVCIAVQPSQETKWKFKCACGRFFSQSSFAGHEKIKIHKNMFGLRDWTTEYTAAGIGAAAAADGDAPGASDDDVHNDGDDE
jgi:hypothetical protein